MKTSEALLLGLFLSAGLLIACDQDDDMNPTDVQLPKTGDLTVRVFLCDPAENVGCRNNGPLQPISGAQVTVWPDEPNIDQDSFDTKLTLADGETEYFNLKPATYNIKMEYKSVIKKEIETVFANAHVNTRFIYFKE